MKQPTRQQLRRQLAALEDTISRAQCREVLAAIYEAQRTESVHPLTEAQYLLEAVLA